MEKPIFKLVFILSLLPFIMCSQQALNLSSCAIVEYEISDHSDANDNGVVCEAMVVLSNSGSYSNDEICQLSNINWTVIVDLYSDGIDDLEFSSSLPSDDNELNDTNGNGIPDLYIPMTMNNEVQSIELPEFVEGVSDHTVTWSIFDDCGLGDDCNTSFTVRDKKSPTPFCVSLYTVEYDGSDVEIEAKNFNVGVFDNCTDHENIRISFSKDSILPSRMITCEDVLNSPILVEVYFWDSSDNIDFCIVYLSVTAASGADCYVEGEIAGNVIDWKGDPVAEVEITLEANALEFPKTTKTDANGNYTFGMQDASLNYRLSAALDKDYLNGVSTLDLVRIMRHILGTQQFLNPYQIIAADINGDYSVKANDLYPLRRLILGVITELPTNDSWNFISSDFEFANPLNPFLSLSNFNEEPYHYKFKTFSIEGYDFIGVKIGDVND